MAQHGTLHSRARSTGKQQQHGLNSSGRRTSFSAGSYSRDPGLHTQRYMLRSSVSAQLQAGDNTSTGEPQQPW